MSIAASSQAPPGFELLHDPSPFQLAFGQLYHKQRAGGAVIGLRVAEHHLNRHRRLHGGALSGFLDAALAFGIMLQPQGPSAALTVSLSIDYLETALRDDWLEADVCVVKMGRRLAFANCEVHSAGQIIASAKGIWMLQWATPSS